MYTGFVCVITLSLNFMMFWLTLLRDPGIKESIYQHYIKVQYGEKNDDQMPPDIQPADDADIET